MKRCTLLYIHLSTLPLRIAIVLTGNLLLLGNQQLTISTQCTVRILVLFYTVNFTTYSSKVDYTILTLVPRQDTTL